MTADGKRFLMTVEPDQGQPNSSTPITVVLNLPLPCGTKTVVGLQCAPQ
jgi:hypothetical protein